MAASRKNGTARQDLDARLAAAAAKREALSEQKLEKARKSAHRERHADANRRGEFDKKVNAVRSNRHRTSESEEISALDEGFPQLSTPWKLRPPLDDGFHPETGPDATKRYLLRKFNLKEPEAEEMRKWYNGMSPWRCAQTPLRWQNIQPSTSRFRGSTTTTYLFFAGHVEVKTSVADFWMRTQTSKYLVCGFFSSTRMLLKRLSGFTSPEEIEFPYHVATLRRFSPPLGCSTPPFDADKNGGDAGGDAGSVSCSDSGGGGGGGSFGSADGRRGFLSFDLENPALSGEEGGVRVELADVPFKYLAEIGPGFFHLRTKFFVLGGNLGSHMSFLRLRGSGRFLVVDAVDVSGLAEAGPGGLELRDEVDLLTHGGALVEAVVATHPFHTVGFPPFHDYLTTGWGAKAQFYGTPRHLRRFPHIAWAGDVSRPEVQRLWEGQGVFMRVPAGAEFDDPQPPLTNHFSNVFVYHEDSRCVHNDDCLCYVEDPLTKMGPLLGLFLRDFKHKKLIFHPSVKTCGIRAEPGAPGAFVAWLEKLLEDWPFENLCTAHNANLCGGANARVRACLDESRPVFERLERKFAKDGK